MWSQDINVTSLRFRVTCQNGQVVHYTQRRYLLLPSLHWQQQCKFFAGGVNFSKKNIISRTQISGSHKICVFFFSKALWLSSILKNAQITDIKCIYAFILCAKCCKSVNFVWQISCLDYTSGSAGWLAPSVSPPGGIRKAPAPPSLTWLNWSWLWSPPVCKTNCTHLAFNPPPR